MPHIRIPHSHAAVMALSAGIGFAALPGRSAEHQVLPEPLLPFRPARSCPDPPERAARVKAARRVDSTLTSTGAPWQSGEAGPQA